MLYLDDVMREFTGILVKGLRVTVRVGRLKKERRDKILFKNYVYTQYSRLAFDLRKEVAYYYVGHIMSQHISSCPRTRIKFGIFCKH